MEPSARNKWLTAYVVDDAATVVTAIFDEADRRDATHQRTWVALADGTSTSSSGSRPKPPTATSPW